MFFVGVSQMIKTILLDIDGVCNTFQHHVFNSLGLYYPDDSHYPVECGWDIVAAANTIAGYDRFTSTAFWRSLTRETWATTPVSPEFDYLLHWAERRVTRDHVYFLTSPTLDPDSVAGKLEWIQSYAPRWMHRQYMIGPAKHLCANAESLLIDDRDKNVEEFISAGGQAILVPRPWNSLHDYLPIEYLEKQFRRF